MPAFQPSYERRRKVLALTRAWYIVVLYAPFANDAVDKVKRFCALFFARLRGGEVNIANIDARKEWPSYLGDIRTFCRAMSYLRAGRIGGGGGGEPRGRWYEKTTHGKLRGQEPPLTALRNVPRIVR